MLLQIKKRYLIISGVALVFAFILLWWLLKSQPIYLGERIPGMDDRPKIEARSDTVIIGHFFDTLGEIDNVIPGDWPRFRGVDFDNINKDRTPLAESWDTAGPSIIWKATLGEGYAGPAVHNGRVYLLD